MGLFFITFFWIGGLLVAGSDNDWMPWTNIIGLLVFFITSCLLGKKLYHKHRCRPKYVITYSNKETGHRLW